MSTRLTAAQEDRAARLHGESFVITCHDHIPPPDDLQLLKQGGITTKFALLGLDARLDAQTQEDYLSSIAQQDGWSKHVLITFEQALRAIERYPEDLLQVRTAADVRRAKREGKIGILLGSEGGKLIEGSIELLGIFYRIGLRQMQLTWAYSNQLSAAETERDCSDPVEGYMAPQHVRVSPEAGRVQSLTETGRQVVAEMNRLGIIVDLCHLSRPAMREVLAVSQKPVLAGHTTAKVLGHRLPSLTDEEIRAVADKGGVIGLHFMTHMLTGRSAPQATIEEFLAQVDHITNVGGFDLLALGPDYTPDVQAKEGGILRNTGQQVSFAENLEHSGHMLNLTRALVAHGYSDEAIKKILGGNILRLMDDVMP